MKKLQKKTLPLPAVPAAAAAVLILAAGCLYLLHLLAGLQETRAELERVRAELAAAYERPVYAAPGETAAEPGQAALTAPEILSGSPVIAHGMGTAAEGRIEDLPPLNCLEGFLEQYAAGVRVFEADLRLTRDNRVVLSHGWNADASKMQSGIGADLVPTRAEFLSKPILERYTPLSFRDLLLLMVEYPDICIITDTKYTNPELIFLQFDSMAAEAQEMGLLRLFDRFIIQLYTENMRQCLDNIYPFPHFIYTMYLQGFDETAEAFRERAAYCAETGVDGITMWDFWWDEDYAPIARKYGVSVYVHTVNDAGAARAFLDSGVSAVYTDVLNPGDFG